MREPRNWTQFEGKLRVFTSLYEPGRADGKTHGAMKELQALKRWVQQLLPWLCARPPVRRYRVTPRCRAAVFRRQLLADVLHSLKQNPTA